MALSRNNAGALGDW